jgi:Right handed beta helix region/Bacterial Ig-like domain (group 2)
MKRDTRGAQRLVLMAACLGLMGLAACGGSASPTTPTPAPTTPAGPTVRYLSVVGPTVFTAIGQTGQFSATATLTDGTTRTVTSLATWQSSKTAVATISTAGLVTAVGLGTTAIIATYEGRNFGTSIQVTTPSSSNGTIAACGVYTTNGPFTLTADIVPTKTSCVQFSGSVGAVLDCQGHDAASLNLSDVRDFTVRNCRLHGTIADSSGGLFNLRINNSSGVTVDHSDELGTAFVVSCTSCTFSNSSFVYPMTGFTPAGFVSAELDLRQSDNAVVTHDTIDGGWDGNFATYQRQGCDDGVLFEGQANTRIDNNVIRNVFDAGIEPADFPTPVTAAIVDNQISHAGYTGIGAYYTAGWVNSVIQGNTVSNTPDLLRFVSDGSNTAPATFVGNQIVGNTLVAPVNLPPSYGGALPPSATVNWVSRYGQTVTGNLVQDNDFGTASPGPTLLPASGFIDGGGNVCQSSTVLACGGG